MSKNKPYVRKVEEDKIGKNTENIPTAKAPSNLLFNKNNYILMASGLGLIFLGLILMSGGKMSEPHVWDESVIYSFRRITLAPMVILLGLLVNVYAIFYKK
jgi:hypothetical protein